MILNQLGISGEHTKGIIYEDSDEGITLKYAPNTQFISWEKSDEKKRCFQRLGSIVFLDLTEYEFFISRRLR